VEESRRIRARVEWWIPAVYAALAGAWIYGSDTLVAAVAGSMQRQRDFSMYKGLAFVLVTAVLLHAGLRWALRRERAAVRRLAESEALLRAITDAIPDPVFLKATDGRWLFSNPATLGVIGKSREEVIGRTDVEIWADPAAGAALMATDRRIMESGVAEVVEERIPGARGHRTFLSTKAPYRDAEGRVTGLIGNARDISDRKLTEARLQDSERWFRHAIQEAPFPVMLHAEDGEVVALSRAWTELSGWRHEDIPTVARWTAQAHPEDQEKVHARIQDLHDQERQNATGEWTITCQDGSRRIWDFSSASLGAVGDDRKLAVSMAADVTDRRRAEAEKARLQAQLQHAQKMESLGSLAGGVAHDMNNVLGAILGLASAHVDGQPAGSPARQAFATIIKAAQRGGKMVNGLLSLARQNPAEERELDLNGILREDVHLLERTTLARVHLDLDLAPDLLPIRGDASALAHAVMNLCLNAVDAMEGQGTLKLRTRNAGPAQVELRVEDTGCGMPPEVLSKALDPFFTTKDQGKGTGLGLSIVYSTVKAHRGELEIQSTPSVGTAVILRLPASEPNAGGRPEEGAAAAHREPGRQGTLKVLLIDDDDLIQSSTGAIMDLLGHQTTIAGSGEEALDLLRQGLAPDIVILDMNMPGWGGAGTLPRLRERLPSVPVLLATGRADQTALDLVEAHAKVILLAKPFNLAELQAHLDALATG